MTDELDPHVAESTTKDMLFKVHRQALASGLPTRLGRLEVPSRTPIETPNFIATTSRGAVPHLTPDNLAKHAASIGGAYMALEDCESLNSLFVCACFLSRLCSGSVHEAYQQTSVLDKRDPHILKTPSSPSGSKPLHAFTAFPQSIATVMGPRRSPAVVAPVGNGSNYLSIWTSTGGANLTISDYISYVQSIQPDIAIGPADLFHTSTTPPSKKLVRMAERTEEWMDQMLEGDRPEIFSRAGVSIFAPILGVPYPIQWQYLKSLADDHAGTLSGLAIYNVEILPELDGDFDKLRPLPRLSMQMSTSPQQVLKQVLAGIDLCTVPFLNTASDAGIALSFVFPPPGRTETQGCAGALPLGVDMRSVDHEASLSPLVDGCTCYSCTKHHRAYTHHLLNANEMLAWTLLQVHNHHVMGRFFEAIRSTLATSPTEFRDLVSQFTAQYEGVLPQGTGTRPRARGYHFKSMMGQDKVNAPKWESFEGEAVSAPTAT